METFLTADHHHDHDGIIQMCNRPFYSEKHIRKEMIKKHDEIITNSDNICFIGNVYESIKILKFQMLLEPQIGEPTNAS